MISPMAEALISFPVEICLDDAVSANLETYWTTMCTMVLENRLMSVMRFKSGDVSPAAPARSPQPVHEPNLILICCGRIELGRTAVVSCTGSPACCLADGAGPICDAWLQHACGALCQQGSALSDGTAQARCL